MKTFSQLLDEQKQLNELEKCTTDVGESGWKFGNGPCYLNKEDARKQMIAAIINGYKPNKK